MQMFPLHILVVWDIINAFNEFNRAALLEHCRATEAYHDMVRLFESEMRPRSLVFALVEGKLTLLEYRSVDGGQQGATTAVMGHNIVTLPFFKAADQAVQQSGGYARAIMDDLAVVGDPEVVWPALRQLEEDIFRVVGLRKHATKPSVYSPSGQYGDMPEGYSVGSNGGGETGWPVGYGVMVAGNPVGDEIFKCNAVRLNVRSVCGVIETVHSLLRLSPNSRDHAFHIERLSLSHRLDFLAQVVPPDTPGVLELFREVDECRLAALAITLGVNPAGSQDELQDPGLVRDRSFLPVRAKGLGLTRTADIAHSAFCGAIELVLPRFPEATDEHGIPVLGSGLFPNLVAVVGNRFNETVNRYSAFIDSGASLGRSFELSWECMRMREEAEARLVLCSGQLRQTHLVALRRKTSIFLRAATKDLGCSTYALERLQGFVLRRSMGGCFSYRLTTKEVLHGILLLQRRHSLLFPQPLPLSVRKSSRLRLRFFLGSRTRMWWLQFPRWVMGPSSSRTVSSLDHLTLLGTPCPCSWEPAMAARLSIMRYSMNLPTLRVLWVLRLLKPRRTCSCLRFLLLSAMHMCADFRTKPEFVMEIFGERFCLISTTQCPGSCMMSRLQG
jgi:hypothetical protein